MKRPSKEKVEREIAALDTLDTKALQARWADLYHRDPPARIRAGLLRLGIAYRLQERAFSGLKPRTVRLLKKLASELRAERGTSTDITTQLSARPTVSTAPTLTPGMRLMREWNGATEIVDVVAEGFVWRETTYRTLSAVAVAITGTKWSGPKFFGLVTAAPSTRDRPGGSRSGLVAEVS